MRKLFITICSLVLVGLSATSALAYSLSNPAPGFGPDQYQELISDSQFTALSMNENDINAFLKKTGSWSSRDGGVSWLADYVIPEYQTVLYKYNDAGVCKWASVSVRQYNDVTNEPLYGSNAAALIARESEQHGINPSVLLVTLEKESSAITSSSPLSDAVEKWVLGYGWNDNMAACGYNQADAQARAINYGGVGQQIAYSISWFQSRMGTYANSYSTPFTSGDGGYISARNVATRVLYAYTPYVYNGNYNFWLLTQKWFSPPSYSAPLAHNPGDGTVYLIDGGKKWPVTGRAFIAWGFSWSSVQTITAEQLALPTGTLWTHLPLGEDGTVYYIDNGRKRPLTSPRLMNRYSFDWADVTAKPESILEEVPYGLPMFEALLPTGDGTVYVATASTLYAVTGSMYNDSWGFAWSDTARVPAYTIYNLQKGPLLTNMVVPDNGDGTAYFIDNGTAFAVSGAMASAWNLNLGNIIRVGAPLLADLKQGGLLTNLATKKGGDGTVYQIRDKKKYPIAATYFNRMGLKWSDVKTVSGVQLDPLPTGAVLR